MERKIKNLKAALAQAVSPEKKIRILLDLGYAHFSLNLKAAKSYSRKALHLAEQLKDEEGLMESLNLLSDILRMEGKLQKAKECATIALKISRKGNYKKWEGDALNNLGLIFWHKGEFERAVKYFKESLNIRKDLQDEFRIAASYNNLGLLLWEMGDLSSALSYQEESLKIKEKIQDERGKGVSYLNLGLINFDLGDWEKAMESYFRALAIKEKQGEKVDIGLLYNNIGEIFLKMGNSQKAKDYFLTALQYAEQTQSPWMKAETLGNLGEVHFLEGDFLHAANLYEADIAISQELEDKEELTETYRRKAELLLAEGRIEEAEIWAKRALTLALKTKAKKEEGNARRVLGNIQAQLKKNEEARNSFLTSLACFKSLGKNFELGKVYLEYGKYLKEIGQEEESENYLYLAQEIFRNLSAVPYLEKVDSLLLEIATPRNEESLLYSLIDGALKFSDLIPFGNYCLNLLAKFFKAKTGYFQIYGLAKIFYGEIKEEPISQIKSTDKTLIFPIKFEDKEIGILQLELDKIPSGAETFRSLIAKTLSLACENLMRRKKEEVPISKQKGEFPGVLGKGEKMKEMWRMIEKVAPTRTTILLTGESGTGKELVAQTIHNLSPFSSEPFLPINCAAIPETLLESELFGIEKGTATGVLEKPGKLELAKGGTIFLDEIGDMSLSLQAKILRVLEERKFFRVGGKKEHALSARVIAATNKDLSKEIKAGRFREDLYFRLNVLTVSLPPLRERREDIPDFCDYFIKKYNKEHNKNIKGLTKDVLSLFLSYNWPGNVRELENVMERAIILSEGDFITISDLPPQIKLLEEKMPFGLEDVKAEFKEKEKAVLLKLLQENKWQITKVAKQLGTNRKRIYRLMQKYGIKRPK